MNLQSVTFGMVAGIIGGILLIIGFVTFLVIVMKRESRRARARQQELARRALGAKTRPGPSAWGDADSGRGAREKLKTGQLDAELPPLPMEATDWGNSVQDVRDSQSSITASQPRASPSSSIYRTGFNPFYKNEGEIQVEEVADLIQQADLMMTLENYSVAIGMLTRHIRETEKPVPKAWLMLFELYIKTGRREQYDNLAKGFRALFNSRLPSWDVQQAEEQRGFESYVTVLAKVQRLWGLAACKSFMESLLYDDRGGARQGFTLLAYAEILFLIEIIDTSNLIEQEQEERRAIELKLQLDPPR